jgi:hypothetical protein
MNAMRRLGLAALGLLAIAGGVGCGGASAPQPAYAPQPTGVSASVSVEATASAPGYDQGAPPAPPPAAMEPSSADAAVGRSAKKSAPRAEAAPDDHPGLGTQWGETRTSRISMVDFQRADRSSPFATAALFYNDEEGARAMTASSGFRRTPSGMFTVAGGLVSLGLRDEGRRLFSGFATDGRNYAVGESGHRYTIVLRNNTSFRLEVVVSVDGLDVLDGKAAAFAKRGYIMDPRGELEIDGFRQSMDAVAAFRFGSVRGSYAGQKTGDTRNVGVIGLAVFNEVGTNPVPWSPDEVQRRRDANPFPGQFATPP